MGDAKIVKDSPEQIRINDAMYDEMVDELREFRELENMQAFLLMENGRLKSRIESLAGELEGINVAVSLVEADLALYETRITDCSENIEVLDLKRNELVEEISNLHLQIKAASEDEESSANLEMSLRDELAEIEGERAVVIKRLNDIKTGLQRISNHKAMKLPHLKGYKTTLKQIYNIFKESQNRMEVSLILRQKQ